MTQYEFTNSLLMIQPTDIGLTGTEKTVFVHLSTFADSTLKCFPSLKKVSQVTGLSESTVKRAIKKLEALKLIVKTRRYSSSGPTSNLYKLSTKHLLKKELKHKVIKSNATVIPSYLAEDGNFYSCPAEYYQFKTHAKNKGDAIYA